jgi:ferric enterobactin receptor
MRLAGTIKYLLRELINSPLLLVLFFIFPAELNLNAQIYRQDFHNISLSEALGRVSKQYDIKVAFDSGKLSSLNIDREVTGNSLNEFLSDLLLNSGFEYKYRYNIYLIFPQKRDNINSPKEGGQILGKVSDRETGEFLPYATIAFDDQNILVSASENGSFCIKNIYSNPVHLVISYIGYNQLDTAITWIDPQINLDLRLSRREHLLDTIVIKGEKLEMINLRNDVDFAATIDPSRLSDLPVLAETDVFRMLQLLPGISYAENSSGMSIRGGSSDQNLILFDGQTLYNLSHYYGVVSALNPNVIKDLLIYKGGYDSRFGERVSGIVDITGKSGNQVKPSVYGDVNLLSANVTAELPVSKKITVLGAFRRSYSDLYSTGFSKSLFERNMDWFGRDSINIVNQTRPKFYFYDYNGKLTISPNKAETFFISLYGGRDHYENFYSGTSNTFKIEGTDNNTWSNYGISTNWVRQWNESLLSNIQIGTSGYTNMSSNLTKIDRTKSLADSIPSLPDSINLFNTFNQNELCDIYLSLRNTLNVSNNSQLNFGFLTRRNTIYYHKDAEKIYVYDNTNLAGWTSSAYIQDKIRANDKLTIKPGFRLTFYGGTGKLYFEPRVSANYRISGALSVRMAAGRYYQFINQVLAQQETAYNKNFWVLADDYLHPVVNSNHFILGFTAEKGRFLFDGETYIKSFSGLQEYIFLSQFLKNSDFHDVFPKKLKPPEPDPAKPSYFLTGNGRSYGLDLMLKYESSRFTSWLSYSYGRSLHQFKDINFGEDIPAPTDLPHQFSWTNMVAAGKWNFGTITLLSSGRSYVDFTKGTTALPLVRIYKRLPEYFRSDFSVNYNFSVRKAKFKTGATFINLFNTENYFDINTRKFDFENYSFSETTLIQSQTFSINLFLHFVF